MKDTTEIGMASRVWRFGVIGGISTFIHISIGMGMHHGLGATPLWSNAVAFICALMWSFWGHSRVTFPEGPSDGSAFVRFATVALMGLALNQIIVWIVTGLLGGPYWLGLAIVVTTVPVVTFGCLRYWAFRH